MDTRISDITFSELTALVKAENDQNLLDGLDRILAAVLILLPAATGTSATWALIAPKNELVKIGRALTSKLTRKRRDDFLHRQRRVAAAHTLVCYTAFFDAASRVTSPIGRQLDLSAYTRASLLKEGLAALKRHRQDEDTGAETTFLSVCGSAIAVPHPVFGFRTKTAALQELYDQLAGNLQLYLTGLPEWEAASEKFRSRVTEQIADLSNTACELYTAQYFTLAAKYPDFFIWADLAHHRDTEQRLAKLDARAKTQIALAADTTNRIDLGLADLEAAVGAIPSTIATERAQRIVDSLSRRYRDVVAERVIDDRYTTQTGQASLNYPRKHEIFVPQAFKAVRYAGSTGSTARLEDDAVWEDIEKREQLGPFLMSYLSSPYSVETPLIILGHPGSGKSLLTEMLAARLSKSQFNALRVPLRDINAEAEIRTQLELQISQDARRDIEWADYSEPMRDTPPVVILDGFDELLQASGKVHAHYLDRVHEFQRREATDGRPVRIIVTSRITLIDKAHLPHGSTVLRLEEFDEPRRERWIDVWNRHNTAFFAAESIQRFSIPRNDKIIELSRQPLLLLMLALFDSESNQLSKHGDLDQTLLYNRLLRRFIDRERLKGADGHAFRELDEAGQEKEIEDDMRRLGVAAMSMFNRRTLHIQKDDLDSDIEYFELERKQKSTDGRLLSQAELLLGSFFFVHESKSRAHTADEVQSSENSAFEFLHNTFGEFLTADFILSHVITETMTVSKFRSDPDLGVELDRRLSEPDKLRDAWFSALAFTPLYTRPVIVRMIREWARHLLNLRRLDRPDFLSSLEAIVTRQVRQLLLGNTAPSSMMTGGRTTPYGTTPLLGHYAIYSLNLIVLITMLSDEGYVFDERLISSRHEGGPRAWDQLTALWRSWLAIDDLSGLASVVTARREDDTVMVQPQDRSTTALGGGRRLETIRSAASAIGDGVLAGLTGLHGYDALPVGRVSLRTVEHQLGQEQIDLELEAILRMAADAGWAAVTRERSVEIEGHLTAAFRGMRPTRSHRALVRALVDTDTPVALRGLARGVIPAPDLPTLHALPRGYARDVVRACAALDPRWVDYALRHAVPMRRGTRLFRDGEAMAELLRLSHRSGLIRDLPAQWIREFGDDSVRLRIASIEVLRREGDAAVCAEAVTDLLNDHSPSDILTLPCDMVRAFLRAVEAADHRVDVARWLATADDIESLLVAQPADVMFDLVRLGSEGIPTMVRQEVLDAELYAWPHTRSVDQIRALAQLMSERAGSDRWLRRSTRVRLRHMRGEFRLSREELDELPVRVVRELGPEVARLAD